MISCTGCTKQQAKKGRNHTWSESTPQWPFHCLNHERLSNPIAHVHSVAVLFSTSPTDSLHMTAKSHNLKKIMAQWETTFKCTRFAFASWWNKASPPPKTQKIYNLCCCKHIWWAIWMWRSTVLQKDADATIPAVPAKVESIQPQSQVLTANTIVIYGWAVAVVIPCLQIQNYRCRKARQICSCVYASDPGCRKVGCWKTVSRFRFQTVHIRMIPEQNISRSKTSQYPCIIPKLLNTSVELLTKRQIRSANSDACLG